MVKIIIGNSHSSIKGLSAEQHKDLSNELSFVVGGSSAYYSGYGVRRRSLLSKRGDVPTGLLGRVNAFLQKKKLPRMTVNGPKPPTAGVQTHFTEAYAWQNSAVAAAYKAPRGAIQAPTGTGKSKAMAMLAMSFNLKTLWVVPSLEIKKQTIESYGKLPNVTITNIDDKKLLNMTDFDMLIIDECHHVAAKQYHRLNKAAWGGIYHRYAFSATTFRNDPEEQLLYESIAGPVIYSLSYADAVKNKYIVPIEAYYIESPKLPTNAHGYQQVYKELVVENTIKNTMIADLLIALDTANKSTLCLVREVAHGKILSGLTGLPFINGADEDSRAHIKLFNSGELKAVIGTVGIMSEGVDTKVCEVVVVAGAGKAKSQFMQACGRAVRNYPGKESAKIIIIKDKSHKYLLRHYAAQSKILLDEYGVKPVRLKV